MAAAWGTRRICLFVTLLVLCLLLFVCTVYKDGEGTWTDLSPRVLPGVRLGDRVGDGSQTFPLSRQDLHALLNQTWMSPAVYTRRRSPYQAFYNNIREYVKVNGSFPLHLVDKRSVFNRIDGVWEAVEKSTQGDPFHPVNDTRASCWWEGGRIKCLPSFLLIGAPKSASTSFYRDLSLHPQIIAPRKKEPYFWAANRRQSFEKYTTRVFRKFNHKIQEAFSERGNKLNLQRLISGDGDPGTMWRSSVWHDVQGKTRMREPKYVTPITVSALLPKAQILAILRNPTDRALSHYQHFTSKKKQSKDHFHSLVVSCVRQAKQIIHKTNMRSFAYKHSKRTKFGFLTAGMYYVFLRDWYDVIEQNRIKILRFDDFVSEPITVLQEAASFLSLDPFLGKVVKQIRQLHSHKAESLIHIDTAKNVTAPLSVRKRKVFSGMHAKTRTILQGFYRPFNILLSDLLQDRIYIAWNDNKNVTKT